MTRPLTLIATFLTVVLPTAPAVADPPGLSGLIPPPGEVPKRAEPPDPTAPWCTKDETQDAIPGGILMHHAWLVLRVCRGVVGGFEPGNEGPERLYVNNARIPGLTFDLYPGQVKLTDFYTYDEWLAVHRGPTSDVNLLDRHERHGGALYEVWHDPDPSVFDFSKRPLVELFGPPRHPFGNTYVFVPEPKTSALPHHFVNCHAEPKNALENDPVGCFIWVDYRNRNAFVQLRGSGPGYAEDSGWAQVHPLFPHYARDIYTFLSAVDVTQDTEAQDCVRSGGDWRGEACSMSDK